MSEIFGFYLYAAVIKVALIGAGVVCVLLGFRLFVAGIGTGKGATVEADATKLTLSLMNAAPGTCFALFGAAVVASVAWNAAPSYETERRSPGGGRETISLRGEEAFDNIADYARPLSNGALTLREAAPLLAGLARVLVDGGGRDAEAKAYAQLATSIDPANATALAAQAVSLARLKECIEARSLLQMLEETSNGRVQANAVQGVVDTACP